MKTFKKILYMILDWTWCFPQTLLGAFVYVFIWKKDGTKEKYCKTGEFVFVRDFEKEYNVNIIIRNYTDHVEGVWGSDRLYNYLSGASLGRYIVLKPHHSMTTIRHEYGHVRQSRMLGPLYLFVVGIPSAINNLRSRKDTKVYENYYNMYPENWADRLGGVTRNRY